MQAFVLVFKCIVQVHSSCPDLIGQTCCTLGFLAAAAFLCSWSRMNWGPTASLSSSRVSPPGPFSLLSAILSTMPVRARKASFLPRVDDSRAKMPRSSNARDSTCAWEASRVIQCVAVQESPYCHPLLAKLCIFTNLTRQNSPRKTFASLTAGLLATVVLWHILYLADGLFFDSDDA